MNIKNIIKVGSLSLALLFGGCENFFEVKPGDMLLEKDSYSNLNEVYSNFLGLNTTLQKAAEQYVIMAELLGDNMEPTENAPTEYWEAWRYQATNGNDVIDPTIFYNIIVQSNDFLRHVVKFNQDYPAVIEENVYKGMISSAMANRAWAYMTVGKFFGQALYFDIALSSDIDLSKYKMLKFDELVDELIFFLNTGVDGVNGFNEVDWTKILNNTDYSWNRMSISSDAVISELHLWDGNYVDAAKHLALTLNGLGIIKKNPGASAKFSLDATYAGSKWATIFNGAFTAITDEAFTAVPYDFSKGQTNNLQYWFSNVGENVYYFRPTDSLISKYENTVRLDGRKGDIYRGINVSYVESGKDKVINRYSLGKNSYSHDATVYIYRTSELFLMLAEALNGLGDLAAADSLLNVGLVSSWDGSKLLPPFNTPTFTANTYCLRNSLGVRGRAGVAPNYLRDFVAEDAPLERKQAVLDSLIAEESALEQAFEGKRWFTLMRMARNNNRPEMLANEVVKKFPEGERESYRSFLMNPANWFIKYDQLHVIE